jgi:hypothetical protein
MRLLMGALVAAAVGVAAAGATGGTDPSAGTSDCPVTHPNGRPGSPFGHRAHGHQGIFIDVGPRMTIFAVHDRADVPAWGYHGVAELDGTVYAKFLWFRARRAEGRLRVTGVSLDSERAPVRAYLSYRGRSSAYTPSHLIFPRAGCYRITARSASSRLDFTVLVVRPHELGCPTTEPNGIRPPGARASDWYGEDGLWVRVGPHAVLTSPRAEAQPDGSIRARFVWRRARRAAGVLRVHGSRLDDYGELDPHGDRLRATLEQHGRGHGAVASTLAFSRPGCWNVEARSGGSSLSLVLDVR